MTGSNNSQAEHGQRRASLPVEQTLQASLAQQLSSPIKSTDELLSLIVPPLARLDLLDDDVELVTGYNGAYDTARLLKRQIGLVQKVMITQVWPDWGHALAAELGPARARLVFERWFVPPSCANSAHAEVAISALSTLQSLLSSSNKPPLSLTAFELAVDLLARLTRVLTLKDAYMSIFERKSNVQVTAIDPASAKFRWQTVVKDFINLPTRVANAAGSASSGQASSTWRPDIPGPLEYR